MGDQFSGNGRSELVIIADETGRDYPLGLVPEREIVGQRGRGGDDPLQVLKLGTGTHTYSQPAVSRSLLEDDPGVAPRAPAPVPLDANVGMVLAEGAEALDRLLIS